MANGAPDRNVAECESGLIMRTRKKIGAAAALAAATLFNHAIVTGAEPLHYARAIGEPPEPETRPAPRPAPPPPAPAPTRKPPERAPTPPPAEPVAAKEEDGFKSSYIWIGLGVAAALAALGGGGGGGNNGGGSSPSH